jgi:hypothetical protein
MASFSILKKVVHENFWFHKVLGSSSITAQLMVSQEGFSFFKVVQWHSNHSALKG